jgi:hypothetical protein
LGSRIIPNRSVFGSTPITALALALAGVVLSACGGGNAHVAASSATVSTVPRTTTPLRAVPDSHRVLTTPGVAERANALPALPPLGRLVPPGARTRSGKTSAPGARKGVAVFGDSLAVQTWGYVQRIATDRGQPFHGGAYGGTALCDWLPAITRALHRDRPAYLVIAFAGNNLTPCTLAPHHRRQVGAPLVARYRRDAQRAIKAARATKTKVFLVGPPAMRNRVWNADAAGLRAAMHALAVIDPGVVYLDARAVLSPNGYRPRRPCLRFETKKLGCRNGAVVIRATDGVHLAQPIGGDGGYSSGAWRYANLLLRGIPNAQ